MATFDDLLTAVNAGDAQRVQALLAANPRIAIRPPVGQSVLLAAIYRGRQDLVELLLPHIQPDIFEAAALGDTRRVRELAAKDPRLLREHTIDGWTALHLAAFVGHRDTAEALLELGSDLSVASKNEMSNQPLHAAVAGKRDHALVELLLEKGADANARAATGVTALHLAASRGDGALCEMLIRKGADAAAKMDDGATADGVAKQRGHDELAEKLRMRVR